MTAVAEPRAARLGVAAQVPAFVVTTAALLLLAFNGGAFDIVVRQEAGLIVWWVLAFGVALGVLPLQRLSRPAVALVVGFALFAAWTLASLSWTASAELTLAEGARVVSYLGLVILLVTAITRRGAGAVVAGVLAAGAVVVIAALATRLHPSLISTPGLDARFGRDRLNYPLNYWNAVGLWAAMTGALALAWGGTLDRVWARSLTLAIVPVAGAVDYLTYSRTGLAALAIALVVAVALAKYRWMTLLHAIVAAAGTVLTIVVIHDQHAIARGTGSAGGSSVLLVLAVAVVAAAVTPVLTSLARVPSWRASSRVARTMGAVALVALAAVCVAFGPRLVNKASQEFSARGVAEAQLADPSDRLTNLNGLRKELWASALDAFRSEPLHGIGAGGYEYWWSASRRYNHFARDGHSIWIENLAELGVIGVAILALIAGSIVAVLWTGRPQRTGSYLAPAVAVVAVPYALGSAVDWMWESTAVTVFMLVLVGAAAGTAGLPRRRIGLVARLPLVACAIAAMLLLLPGMVAQSLVRDSQRDAARGDVRSAASLADQAVQSEPWAASPYLQRALVSESSGNLAAGVVDARRATEKEPTNWRNWLILARIEAEAGHPHAAVTAFARARHLHKIVVPGGSG